MQIFMPYKNLVHSVVALDDARLNKQITECAQIVSTALWLNDCGLGEAATANGDAYLPTHEHHPLCKWASENAGNMYLVAGFGITCCSEWESRGFAKHAVLDRLERLAKHFDAVKSLRPVSSFPNCTTNHKHIEGTNEAYRLELRLKWQNDKCKPTWTNRIEPDFK